MRFSALGPVAVADDDGSELALGGWKQRAVLALLLHAPNQTISADLLITDIWGEGASEGARDALYTYISGLRGAFGKDRLVRDAGGYRLTVRPGESDMADYESDLTRAQRLMGSAPEKAIRVLNDSLGMWRGRAYDGHEDLPSVAPEAARLDELRITGQELRFEAMLRMGDTPEPAEIDLLCNAHPLREQPWSLMMRAQYRAGRQADALRTFHRFREILGEELGIEPSPAISRLEEQILLQDPSLEASRTTPTNLPAPLTSFIGRLDEQARLDQAIHDHRLVSVLGPGGAGKTRLAVETARTLLGSFPDGVWLVDLARVTEPSAVKDSVAKTLGIAYTGDPTKDLIEWLSGRESLIILDNCEHLVDEAGALAVEILERTDRVKILVTSRIAIDRPGEHRVNLLGLATEPDEEESSEAAALFLERAAAISGGVEADEMPITAIEAVCDKVEGLPLAIELAASRSDVLAPQEIDKYLDESFDLLSRAHAGRDIHRSIAATISWSVSLLEEDEQRRFRALGVFEGPFTASAAASVFDDASPVEAVSRLKKLAGASLVVSRRSETGDSVYRLLEPIRAHARIALIDSGAWDEVANLHDSHYLESCRAHRVEMFGSGRVDAARQIEIEMADYLAAWDRIEEEDPASALPFAWALGHYWLATRAGPGFQRISALIETVGDRPSTDYADVLTIGSWLAMWVNNWEQGIPWADRAIEIYEGAGDQLGLAYSHVRRGHWAFGRGDIQTAMESLPLGLEICNRIGFEEGKAWPMVLIGQARRWSDDESEEVRRMVLDAKSLFVATDDALGQVHAGMVLETFLDRGVDERLGTAEEMVRIAEHHGGDNLLRPTAYHALAYSTWDNGEHERAKGINRACVRSALASGNLITLGLGLMQAARFAGLEGDAQQCARLYGAGRAHFSFEVAPFQVRYEASAVAAAKQALGGPEYENLFEAGGRLSPEEAATLVLD